MTTWAVSGGVEGSNATVNTLALNSQNEVLIGGYFSKIGGQTRWMLGSVKSNGDLGSWYPTSGFSGVTVRAMALNKTTGTLYMGGDYSSLSGQTRKNLSAVTSSGVISSWYPANGVVGGVVNAVDVNQSTGEVYIAGNFTQVDGLNRFYAASITSGGVVTSWNPNPYTSGSVKAISVDQNSGNIYLGGSFNVFGGKARSNFVIVKPSGDTQ
ncbi:MAG: hypothetical protein ACK41T_08030 [Pseudobdellovibrio sp.]